eukprot:comp5201_c0_seq1/m.1242 comp5201_c0_seq1/g.1242  ORF comp5201_c0_seq1/g.1242 comp5201_c0_seq1/m.1242 type:complete len:309 (-) comp5201_c0_seq1:11-937(-)
MSFSEVSYRRVSMTPASPGIEMADKALSQPLRPTEQCDDTTGEPGEDLPPYAMWRYLLFHVLAIINVVLVGISYPGLKRITVYAVISASDTMKTFLLVPLLLITYGLWVSPFALVSGKRQHFLLASFCLFWIGCVAAFTMAYVWANTVRHARNEKLKEMGLTETNAQLTEQTTYVLDELVGHWLPLMCTLAVFVCVVIRETRVRYFVLDTKTLKISYAASTVVLSALCSVFFANYCYQGHSFMVFYPSAVVVIIATVCVHLAEGNMLNVVEWPAGVLVLCEVVVGIVVVAVYQAVEGFPYDYGFPVPG